ncbi:MAG: hypothetical protein KA791_05255 [Flavobacteriales bacterium]|nr:hypothetical protein [Flavobacteriales bacterium]
MNTSISVSVTCETESISVNTTGGTAPYSLVIESHAVTTPWWSSEQIVSNDADGDLTTTQWFDIWHNTDQGRVTVTDALGCVATDSTELFTPVGYRVISLVGRTPDCESGLNYAVFDIGDNNSPSQNTYRLDNGPVLPLTSWSFLVSPGTHTLEFPGYDWWFPYTYCTESITFIDVPIIDAGDCGVNLRMRAALDGALPSGTLMADGLRSAGLIPMAQPYTALGYNFVGSPSNITITPAQLAVTGNNAIVDWLVAELRSTTTTVVCSKPVLLQRDGDVVDADGDTYLNFPVAAGNYYVALRHRNHLGVMTSTPRELTVDPTPMLIDFRSNSTGTYGTNARVLKGSVQCLWAGDATGNGQLRYTGSSNDRDPILIAVGSTTPNNAVPNVYDRRDTNLDGVIKYTGTANDRDIILTNVGSTTPNNTRAQQLP